MGQAGRRRDALSPSAEQLNLPDGTGLHWGWGWV